MDSLTIAGRRFGSRLLLGSAGYPSPHCLLLALRAARVEIVTVGLRRQLAGAGDNGCIAALRDAGLTLLPNTAGCRSAAEAVQLALMARELYGTELIKLEVVGDEQLLAPDPFELLAAARELCARGFTVLPYCTEDLSLGQRLLEAGCAGLMPWAAPIGSGQGLLNPFGLRALRERFGRALLIVDAGLGAPSQAAQAMEMGFDAVLLNSAVAQAGEPVPMAEAFAEAVRAGRRAHKAGLIAPQDLARASTPVPGRPFEIDA